MDVDADGDFEIFTANRGGGSGAYGDASLYDSLRRARYSAYGGTGYSSPTLEGVTLSKNLDDKKGVRSWIIARLEEFNLFNAADPLDVAIREWERRNGNGFLTVKWISNV